jgi:hypothetical protein
VFIIALASVIANIAQSVALLTVSDGGRRADVQQVAVWDHVTMMATPSLKNATSTKLTPMSDSWPD